MLVSSRTPPVPSTSSSISYFDSNTNRSHQTHTAASLIPPTLLPKYFNVPFAVQHGYFRCIRYLLELSYDPNERDSQLRTPLILCSYVDNDRWSLSLTQNLLEKGAKIALEDHARRNAMHHACALQRIHLVQLYLSCLDFNIQAKDCEGNTCLHYVAITGNCEIAELLIKTAEKINVRLDQYVNREGCSAAVLALKYGHIECANQITHRDWDEFFVIPRPLSIYETPPTTDDNQTFTTTTTSTSKKKNSKINSHPSSTIKNDIRPSTFSFGLLKIIFNENDSSYSTRLAGICNDNEKVQSRRRIRHKKPDVPHTSLTTINKFNQTKSTGFNSTDALVNELQSITIDEERKISIDTTGRTSPRVHLMIQQHSLTKPSIKIDDSLFSNEIHKTKSSFDMNDETKSKTSIPSLYRQSSNSTLNHYETNISHLHESSLTKNQLKRPKTALNRNQTSVNAIGIPSRLSSPKTHISSSQKKSKKKTTLINRVHSATFIPKYQHSNLASETSTYSQTLYAGRPLSAMVQNHQRYPLIPRPSDSSCAIREAKGVTSRYNKPEKLFGIKPEELFGLSEHQSKLNNREKINENIRVKRNSLQKQEYIWQQDVDKLVNLYNIHHSSNYRPSAVPPPPPPPPPADTITELTSIGRTRRMSITKYSSRSSVYPKQSTLASLNIPQRNSISRPSIKVTNT